MNMDTIPTITEQDVRSLVGEASFQRGQKYFRAGSIFDTRRAGMTLKAQCEGSRSTPYRVEVTFNNTGVADTDCSCPIGGYCKHVVALLLTWLARPEAFIEQQDIEEILQQCDKAELITLIKHMLQRDPDLEYLLTTVSKSGMPFDPQLYRNQVETAYRRAGGEWGAASEVADELLDIKETADNFAERHDYAGAIAVYDAIATGVIDHYYEYNKQDESGELDGVVTECIYGLKQCLDAVQDNSPLREQILQTLFAIYRFDIEAGSMGFGEDAPGILLEDTTAGERLTIAGWVREAIADLFIEYGQDALAERIVQQRAWRSRDSRLLEWLKKHAKTPLDAEDKLAQAAVQFQEHPIFEGYKEVRQLATQCGRWEKMRPELLAFLKAGHLNEILAQVALDEDDTDEIIKIVQTAGSPAYNDASNRIIMVVQAAEETKPEAALNFYLRYVAYLVSNRNRHAYEQASRILVRMRTLYEKLGKHETWTRYITRLREHHRGLKALQTVLSTAGL